MMVITAKQILQGFIKQAVPTIRNQEDMQGKWLPVSTPFKYYVRHDWNTKVLPYIVKKQ